jgi:phenylacetate-CoA ligase
MPNLKLNNEEAFESAKREIDYAYSKTVFFRKHMDEAQLLPANIKTAADFSRILPTEKKHYRKNFPVGVLAEGYSLNNKMLYHTQSSGTTGERLQTVEEGWIYMQRAVDCLSVYPGLDSVMMEYPRKHVRYAAPNCSDVECASPNSTMKDRILPDGTLVLSVYHDLLTTPERIISMNIAELEEYQARMYYIDPTHLAFLLRNLQKRGYTPPKAPVLTSYSLCTKISKRQIIDSFGKDAPVIETFAMSELGWLAAECPCGNIHLNSQSFYLELLCNGRNAEPGELAELYVTTLDNGCIPHIRYRTGDVFRLSGSRCPCGSDFPVVQVEGRLRNHLFQNGQSVVTPKALDDLIGDAPWLDLYKLVQADENDFTFSFISNDKYEENMESYIVEGLFEKLGKSINLHIEKNVDYISTERSGKFLSCVSTIGEKLAEKGLQL